MRDYGYVGPPDLLAQVRPDSKGHPIRSLADLQALLDNLSAPPRGGPQPQAVPKGSSANPVIHNPPVAIPSDPPPDRLDPGSPPGSGGGCSGKAVMRLLRLLLVLMGFFGLLLGGVSMWFVPVAKGSSRPARLRSIAPEWLSRSVTSRLDTALILGRGRQLRVRWSVPGLRILAGSRIWLFSAVACVVPRSTLCGMATLLVCSVMPIFRRSGT